MDAAYPDVDLLVFGHSHIPWDTTTPRGLRLLNPGSPTDRRRQPACTYAWLDLEPGVPASRARAELRRLPSPVRVAGRATPGTPG